MFGQNKVNAVAFLLAAAAVLTPQAYAASCGTVAVPLACTLAVGPVTYTATGFSFAGTDFSAAEVGIDITPSGTPTGVRLTFSRIPPPTVFSASAGQALGFGVTYTMSVSGGVFGAPVQTSAGSHTEVGGALWSIQTIPNANNTCAPLTPTLLTASCDGTTTNSQTVTTFLNLFGNAGTGGADRFASLTGFLTFFQAVPATDAAPTMSKQFNPATIAIAGTSVLSFNITNPNAAAMTAVAFSDTFPAGVIVSQAPNATNSCGGTFAPVAGAGSISLTGGSIAANGSCTLSVTVQATTPGTKVNTTGTVSGSVNAVSQTGLTAMATLQVTESQVSFLIRYAANLNIGESVVNFTNTGESSTQSFGANNFAQNGDICANVFAYSPDEQLVSCCSCNVTPNGLNSLSVKADLGTNTLTPIIPSSLVIKVVATAGGTACAAASAATVNTAVLQPGLEAWGSTIHALPVAGGTSAGTYGVAETPFLRGTISQAELIRMAQLCSFIRANGSGYGICKSCKVGGLGASSK